MEKLARDPLFRASVRYSAVVQAGADAREDLIPGGLAQADERALVEYRAFRATSIQVLDDRRVGGNMLVVCLVAGTILRRRLLG
jgi:hypothetical protein